VAKNKIQVIGGERVDRALAALGEAASDVLEQAAQAGAEPVRESAERLAPELTGKLSESIVQVILELSDSEVEIAVGPDKEAFWGLYQEFGTPHHPAQPFLRPAFDENQERILEAIADELRKELGL